MRCHNSFEFDVICKKNREVVGGRIEKAKRISKKAATHEQV
jgi:hypothetical protein